MGWASDSCPEYLLETSSVCSITMIVNKQGPDVGSAFTRPMVGSWDGPRKTSTPGPEGENERQWGEAGVAVRAAMGGHPPPDLSEPSWLLYEMSPDVHLAPVCESLVHLHGVPGVVLHGQCFLTHGSFLGSGG